MIVKATVKVKQVPMGNTGNPCLGCFFWNSKLDTCASESSSLMTEKCFNNDTIWIFKKVKEVE